MHNNFAFNAFSHIENGLQYWMNHCNSEIYSNKEGYDDKVLKELLDDVKNQ
jgi:hypothetical protein